MVASNRSNGKRVISVNHFREFHLPFLAPPSQLRQADNCTCQFVWILLLHLDLCFERDTSLAGNHLPLRRIINQFTMNYLRNTYFLHRKELYDCAVKKKGIFGIPYFVFPLRKEHPFNKSECIEPVNAIIRRSSNPPSVRMHFCKEW